MRRFTNLYLALDGTNSTTEKKDALKTYLAGAPDGDAAWAVALLTGNRPRGIGATGLLRTLCLEVTGHPEWLFDECRSAVGDLSETIALLLPPPAASCDESLADTITKRVLSLRGADETVRRRIITDAWSVMDSDERLVLHKLIRGGFRVGVQKRTVTRPAEAHGLDFDLVAHRLTDASRDVGAYRADRPRTSGQHLERPYPFFLAHPLGGRKTWETPPSGWSRRRTASVPS